MCAEPQKNIDESAKSLKAKETGLEKMLSDESKQLGWKDSDIACIRKCYLKHKVNIMQKKNIIPK